jgi:hypothetical protein
MTMRDRHSGNDTHQTVSELLRWSGLRTYCYVLLMHVAYGFEALYRNTVAIIGILIFENMDLYIVY